MKVYDCCTFFNEVEILELRLNILNDVVDYFVIVESTVTHQRQPKNLVFPRVCNRFQKFKDKIIYIVADNPPEEEGDCDINGNSWLLENWQRDQIIRGLENCQDDDVLLQSDLDEIVNPDLVRKYCHFADVTVFQCVNYSFYLNFRSSFSPFGMIKMLSYGYFRDLVPHIPFEELEHKDNLAKRCWHAMSMSKVRHLKGNRVIRDGGWHFSYMGGIERVVAKMDSLVEQNITNRGKGGAAYLRNRIQHGLDIYGTGVVYKPTTRRLPKYLLAHRYDYESLFWKGPLWHRFRMTVRFDVLMFCRWSWTWIRRLMPRQGEKFLKGAASRLKRSLVH